MRWRHSKRGASDMNRRDLIKQTLFLGGVTLSAPALMSVLTACSTQRGTTPTALNNEQADTIAEVVDTILPRTSTPGAKDLNVDVFIGRVIDQLMSPADQVSIRRDIDSFNDRAKARF